MRCLDELGVAVVLASSAKGDDLDAFRSVLDVDEHLAGATSSDDADRSKPDRDIFEAALDRFDLDRSRTIVVGDTGWDGDAAQRAAHLTFVGVCSGGWTEAEPVDLTDRGASAVFPTAAELVATLRSDRPPSWLPW